jgi:hypothetical protein
MLVSSADWFCTIRPARELCAGGRTVVDIAVGYVLDRVSLWVREECRVKKKVKRRASEMEKNKVMK